MAQENDIDRQIREAQDKPTLRELIAQVRARPGHRPYSGPSVAALVHEDRDSH